MSEIRVEWDGERLIEHVARSAVRANAAGAQRLLDIATPNVPVQTGFLRDSGTVDVSADGSSAEVGWTAPYAVRVHEGRSGGWLDDAIDEGADQALDAQADALRSGWPG